MVVMAEGEHLAESKWPAIELSSLDSDGRSSAQAQTPTKADWSAEEERVLVRKLDCLIMSLLTLAFFALQLDRGNM